jgi:hypothetical protein
MSPTVLRFWNLRVVIHTKDHQPAHIHVIGPEAEVKFGLGDWRVMANHGFDEKTVRKIREFLMPREREFLEVWNEIHEVEED